MNSTKHYLFIVFASILSFSLMHSQSDDRLCKQPDTCVKDSTCLCYCSKSCGPREITPDDDPVYEDGVCYCKQDDLDEVKQGLCD